jgi:CBS domain-containing protein
MRVRDAMASPARTIRPGASLKEAAAIFAEHGIGGLPVVDIEGRLVGVVTEADILVKESAASPPRGLRKLLHRREAAVLATKAEARTVKEAMTSPAITIESDAPLTKAAERMLDEGVNRLAVVDDEKLVGIVARHDLVRAFARSDSEIERDIREEALRGLTYPEELELRVRGGDVTLRGKVDSRFDAEILPELVRRVPGVVAVDAALSGWDPQAKREVRVAVHRG